MHDKPLIYLDSGNTSQKPQAVIDAMNEYYETPRTCTEAPTTSPCATEALEARAKVARFINAPATNEVVFTKNATEAFNLLARSWGAANLGPGDAVVISEMEHHANIVPWHMLSAEKGFEPRWIPVTPDGHRSPRSRHPARWRQTGVGHGDANVLGTLNDIPRLAEAAHGAGALLAVDGSQYVPHVPTDVQHGADFLIFTGHKMLGPMGIGVLWARAELLEAMPPFLGGGEMILNVTKEGFTTTEIPWKFEAGTPMVAEAVGLGAAIDYLELAWTTSEPTRSNSPTTPCAPSTSVTATRS